MVGAVMRERAPSARHPEPAVLDGYDWLINGHGSVTVELRAGCDVHGVLWLTDDDFACPEGWIRDAVVVRTAAGPVEAVVDRDPRVDPGPPADGVLEAVLAGAAEHGLPAEWRQWLARWDRRRWEPVTPVGPAPASLTELLERDGVEEAVALRSRFGFLAIHGGDLEAMTDVVAARAAELAGASFYAVLHPDGHGHHLPSVRYDPAESARLAEFVDHVDVVISVHGYGRHGRWTDLLAGGRNRTLADHVARHVTAAVPGYAVVTDLDDIPSELRGLHPCNPVNRPRGGGVQLELPPRVRGQSPRSPRPGPDGLSRVTRDLIEGLATAAATWPTRRRA